MDPYICCYTIDDQFQLLDWLEDPTDLSTVSRETNDTGTGASLCTSTGTAALWPGPPEAAEAAEPARDAYGGWQLNSNSGNILLPAWPSCAQDHWVASTSVSAVQANCPFNADLFLADADAFFASGGVHAVHTSSQAADQVSHRDPPPPATELLGTPSRSALTADAAMAAAAAAPSGLRYSSSTATEPPAAAPAIQGVPLGPEWSMQLPINAARVPSEDSTVAGTAAAAAGHLSASLDQDMELLGTAAAVSSCCGCLWSTPALPAADTLGHASPYVAYAGAAAAPHWQQTLVKPFSPSSTGDSAAAVTDAGTYDAAAATAAADASAAAVTFQIAPECGHVRASCQTHLPAAPTPARPSHKAAAPKAPGVTRRNFKAPGNRRAALGDHSNNETQLLMLAEAEAKGQANLSRKAVLQSTLEGLRSSQAQLASRLSALQSDLATMAAANEELRTANGAMHAQLEAVQLRLWGACAPACPGPPPY